MGAGTMTRNMRLGLVILAAVLICAGARIHGGVRI